MEYSKIKEKFLNWYSEFMSTETIPFTIKDQVIILSIVSDEVIKSELCKQIENDSLFRIIEDRSERIKLQINKYAKALIWYLSKNPAIPVMYISCLKQLQLSTNKEINIDEFIGLFHDGFIPNYSLNNLWEKQKLENGQNLVDLITFN